MCLQKTENPFECVSFRCAVLAFVRRRSGCQIYEPLLFELLAELAAAAAAAAANAIDGK